MKQKVSDLVINLKIANDVISVHAETIDYLRSDLDEQLRTLTVLVESGHLDQEKLAEARQLVSK